MQWQPSTGTIGAPGSPETLPDFDTKPLVSYRRQWLLTLLLASVAGWYYAQRPQVQGPGPTLASPLSAAAGVDWFFTLRLPEAPADPEAQKLLERRMDEWLIALREAGFRPIRLTEARAALLSGQYLPPKTVLLEFEPGMRRTYEVVEPILARHQWPAVWLTDPKYLKHPDSAYVSPRGLSLMRQSGLWELGFFNADLGFFEVDPQNPIKPSAHSVRGGVLASRHHALNRGRREKALNRLYVPLSWTGDQLVYSLLAEIPIQKRAQLTYRKLYRRFAGMAIENAPGGTTPPPFNLEPDLESHASTLSWPGTRGIANMQLHFKTASWVGEMWLMLQSETEKRQSIRVGFKEGVVMVRADHLADRPLAVHKLPRLERGPLDAWLRVQNQVLTLRINGRLLPPIDLLQVEAPKEGLVQFYIQDKVRGTAQAAGVDLHLTVLP